MPQVDAMLLILVAIYGAIIAALVWLIRRVQAINRHAVFLGFLTFGLATGILAVLLWPNDSCVLPNVFGVWLGDWMYVQTIEWFGDPHSAQAGLTIPWVFQVPQVYLTASTGLCAAVGLVLEWIYERSTYSHRITQKHTEKSL